MYCDVKLLFKWQQCHRFYQVFGLATLVWMHMVQALTPGATWCLRKLHIPWIIHNARLPPGGSPVDCGLQRPWANIGPTGPAAQNNIYLPRRGRPHFFRQPERKGVEEEEERRWPIYRDWAPECRTLCSLGGCVLCGTIAVGACVCVCIGKMFRRGYEMGITLISNISHGSYAFKS